MRRIILLVLAVSMLAPGTGGAASVLAPPSDPTGLIASDNVRILGSLPAPNAISARFRDDVMYLSTLQGLITYDVSDPRAPRELGRLPLPHFQNEDVDLGRDILLISNDAAESTGILYVVDIADPANPRLRSTLHMGGNPLLGGPGHTASCVLDCAFAWVTDGGGIRVVDLRDPDSPTSVGVYDTPAGGGIVTHDVQVDENGLYWVAGFGGTVAYRLPRGYDGDGLGELVYRTNAEGESTYMTELGLGDGEGYNDFIHHNSLRRRNSSVLYVTEEDYTRPGCRGQGSFQRWSVPRENRGAKKGVAELTPIDQWVTELAADTASPAAVCSAHYFDERDGLIAHGWYQQGLRLLDVTGDEIRQVGYYITPAILAWGAYFVPTDPTGEVVYVLNHANGVDILEVSRDGSPAQMPAVTAPVLGAWTTSLPTLAPDPTLGYACAIPL
jgi:hypothetical protein